MYINPQESSEWHYTTLNIHRWTCWYYRDPESDIRDRVAKEDIMAHRGEESSGLDCRSTIGRYRSWSWPWAASSKVIPASPIDAGTLTSCLHKCIWSRRSVFRKLTCKFRLDDMSYWVHSPKIHPFLPDDLMRDRVKIKGRGVLGLIVPVDQVSCSPARVEGLSIRSWSEIPLPCINDLANLDMSHTICVQGTHT